MKKKILAFITYDDDENMIFISGIPTPIVFTNIEDLKSTAPFAQEMANDLQRTVDVVEFDVRRGRKIGEINPSSQNVSEVNLLDEEITTN